MRVVVVCGTFPADVSHFDVLADRCDLVVYGSRRSVPGVPYTPVVPRCAVREFQPVIASRRGHLFWAYRGLHTALDADRPDVVHVVSEPWGLLAVQAARWKRCNPDARLFTHGCDTLWEHGGAVERAVRRSVARWVLGRCDGYLAESAKAVQQAMRRGLSCQAVTGTAHTNPRDPARFTVATANEKRESRMELGLPLVGTGVGFVGQFTARKGILTAIGAARLLGDDPDLWFAVAGDGAHRADVESAADEGTLTYLGPQGLDGIATLMRALDVIIVPSITVDDWEEQSPRVVIEALLSGCVVVGSDCGAIPEMLAGAGVVVPQGDAYALAEGTRAAAAKAGAGAGTLGAVTAAARYSAGAVASQMEQAWRDSTRLEVARSV